jgi:hypothetical protein
MAMRNFELHNGRLAAHAQSDDHPRAAAQASMPMTIQGPRDEIGHEIAALSPDGEPAHPKDGPGTLAASVGLVALGVVLIAVALGWWLGWAGGVAALAIGAVAVLFNPSVIATLFRMKERKTVADRHNHLPASTPLATVVRAADIDRRRT